MSGEFKGYRCPRCGSEDLDVRITTWAKFRQTPWTGTNEMETETGEAWNNDHEWDGDSAMMCRECSLPGNVKDFAYSSPPEGCLASGVPEVEER